MLIQVNKLEFKKQLWIVFVMFMYSPTAVDA